MNNAHHHMKWIIKLITCCLLLAGNGYSGMAQIQVAQEPRHKTVMENGYLRILDVHLEPGDSALYHKHSLPSVVIFFTATKLGSQLYGAAAKVDQTNIGGLFYAPYDQGAIYHRVWNEDNKTFHVMDIELLRPVGKGQMPLLKEKWLEPAFQQNLVSAYKIQVIPGDSINQKSGGNPLLLVCFAGSAKTIINEASEVVLLKPGKFWWIAAGNSFKLTADAIEGASFVLLELRR
jgi:hypothetical protein